jgi:hypothetical protein
LSPLKPKKLSCGNGPDLVFILFNPNDDAKIGETEAAAVDDEEEYGDGDGNSFTSTAVAGVNFFEPEPERERDSNRFEISLSFPLTTSFFLLPSLICVFRLEADDPRNPPPLPPPPLVVVPAEFRI